MKVYYDKDKKTYDFKSNTVSEMLKELNILKNSVIVAVNNEIVTEDYSFKSEDKIKILSVVSGG
jgi:thiamine biosynthesis protein ThiS